MPHARYSIPHYEQVQIEQIEKVYDTRRLTRLNVFNRH